MADTLVDWFIDLASTSRFSPLCYSVISNTNKDGFIQRAVNASRAYTDIIAGVRDAEIAANQAAVDALEVRTTHMHVFSYICEDTLRLTENCSILYALNMCGTLTLP